MLEAWGDLMAVFNASFQTDGSAFSTSFNGNAVFNVGMAEQVNIEIIDGRPYEGEYIVVPTFEDQLLATKQRLMEDDLLVKEITVNSVSNLSGGYTVTIGG